MAASSQDVLEGIERRRAQLQTNVDKLRKALAQWATWEAEYDALKEEIQAADDPSPAQMREIARNLEGSLVDEKEVIDLLGKPPQAQRSANQVIDMIARRIDYVQLNGSTVEKQLDTAEKQLAGVDVLLEPGMDNEEGLPMMDIEEELDEDGNEISSAVNKTGEGAAELIEVLRKAGLHKDASDRNDTSAAQDNSIQPPSTSASAVASHSLDVLKSDRTAPRQKEADVTPTEPAPPVGAVSPTTDSAAKFKSTVNVDPVERHALTADVSPSDLEEESKIVELIENERITASNPVVPEGESPEDAELRRQMLQYSLSEVGQVVAELDLDRPTASFSDDEYDDDDFNEYDTEDDDDEDEYGRSTRPIITEEYRKQMRELEERLGARMLENVGPQPDADSLAEHMGDIRTMRVRKDDQFDDTLQSSTPTVVQDEPSKAEGKKGVRFADHVDVSELPPLNPKSAQNSRPTPSTAPTISDTIVEHSGAATTSATEPLKPVKVSKFKSARSGGNAPSYTLPNPAVPAPQPVPSGPVGRTLATEITEHAPNSSGPQAPDEFDPVLLNREIQAQYHKARNKFIGQQGGFKSTEADEENPIVEERDGKTKKVSRFMAARLKAEGM